MLGIIVVTTSAHDLRLCTRIDDNRSLSSTSFMIAIPRWPNTNGRKAVCVRYAWLRGQEVELRGGGSACERGGTEREEKQY